MTSFRAPARLAIDRSVVFVLVGAALACAIHGVLLHGLRERRTGDYGVWNALVEGRIGAEIVVIGSSRALVNVDCDGLSTRLGQSCFNLGLNGSHVNLQRPMFDTYLAHNAAPKVVLVTLDPFTFQTIREPYEPEQYLPYLGERDLYATLVGYDQEFRWIRYVPLYGFARYGVYTTWDALEGLVHADRLRRNPRVRGWAPQDIPWDGSFDAFVRTHATGVTLPIELEAVDALDAILQSAERSGARPILTYPPEYGPMRTLSRNRDAVFATFRDVATRHGAAFIDLSADPLWEDRAFFYNSQHLNRRGAKLFSSLLADRMAAIIGSDGRASDRSP
jgi:hypothetical protein